MSIDLILLCIAMAFYIGWKASQLWHLSSFRSLMQELKITNDQLLKVAKDNGIELDEIEQEDPNSNLPELEVKIEQHPEGLFAYRKADNTFIAQGKDRDTLMENLVHNLSNVRVVVAKEDGADLIQPQS